MDFEDAFDDDIDEAFLAAVDAVEATQRPAKRARREDQDVDAMRAELARVSPTLLRLRSLVCWVSSKGLPRRQRQRRPRPRRSSRLEMAKSPTCGVQRAP
jgi:hypothetical protein